MMSCTYGNSHLVEQHSHVVVVYVAGKKRYYGCLLACRTIYPDTLSPFQLAGGIMQQHLLVSVYVGSSGSL